LHARGRERRGVPFREFCLEGLRFLPTKCPDGRVGKRHSPENGDPSIGNILSGENFAIQPNLGLYVIDSTE